MFRVIEGVQKHLSGTGADFHGKKIFARNLIFSTPTFWPGAVEISTGRRNFDRVAEISLFLRLIFNFGRFLKFLFFFENRDFGNILEESLGVLRASEISTGVEISAKN